MNKIKKWNQFLLENYPLTWHSKFFQLAIAGLLFWIISYFFGYLLFDLHTLKNYRVDNYYWSSNFVSFHVIYCLIIACLWAIYFFKNNALKSYYPLKPFYLAKLFLHLFLAFTILVSAYFPFTYGTIARVKSEMPVPATENTIRKANRAAMWLLKSDSPYHILNRKELTDRGIVAVYRNNDEWEHENRYFYYPDLRNQKYTGNNLRYGNFASKNLKFATKIDDVDFIFFTTLSKYETSAECNSNEFVKEFKHFDSNADLHIYALRNYNVLSFSNLLTANAAAFKTQDLKQMYGWISSNSSDSIRKVVNDFLDVLKLHKIEYRFDVELLLKYLEAKNFIQIKSITGSYDNYYGENIQEYIQNYPDEFLLLKKYKNNLQHIDTADLNDFISLMEKQNLFYIDTDPLNTMFENYLEANQFELDSSVLVVLFIGFFLAWLFVLFEFANFLQFLLSIPIGGVVTILTILGLIYINFSSSYNSNFNYHSGEKYSTLFIFLVLFLIFCITLIGIQSKRFNRKVLGIMVNLSYFIAPALLPVFCFLLNTFSEHVVHSPCGINYENSFEAIVEPEIILLSMIIGLFLYFPFVKKFTAYKE